MWNYNEKEQKKIVKKGEPPKAFDAAKELCDDLSPEELRAQAKDSQRKRQWKDWTKWR